MYRDVLGSDPDWIMRKTRYIDEFRDNVFNRTLRQYVFSIEDKVMVSQTSNFIEMKLTF